MKQQLFKSYKRVIPDDGFVLTSFKDGDDILTYTSARLMICPLTAVLDDLREISEEQDKLYNLQMEEKIRLEIGL